jgi:hypothetical protein
MASNLDQINQSIRDWALNSTKKMQTNLYEGIRADTPVKTGRAQAGWESIDIAKLGDTGIIKNDVEYIGWLEFGSDTVAPHSMVRTNIKRVAK